MSTDQRRANFSKMKIFGTIAPSEPFTGDIYDG